MNLNPRQIEAVEHDTGPLLIIAGAGSGKTRVLTNRVAHLIQNRNVRHDNILAVTFTNKAAGEMRERIGRMVGSTTGLWVGTFHSTCARILRTHGDKIGLPRHFSILDESDQTKIIKESLKTLDISDKLLSPQSALDKISRSKDSLINADDYPDGDFYGSKVASVYRHYQATLQKEGSLDFGDLIMKTIELLNRSPEVLFKYQNQFKYILIDEYQDTNHAQYELIRILARGHKNLCVVGDPDQSIYRWRGADINNILEFERDFPGAKVITLDQNYRSTKTILNASDALIENNETRRPKTLKTENPEGDPISVSETGDEKSEAASVVRKIKTLTADGFKLNEIAIFYRTNAQSRVFEDELRRASIPYIIYGGIKFYNRSEIKDIIAYLKLLQNRDDDTSLKRIINSPVRGIGKTTIEKLWLAANNNNCSIYNLITAHADGLDLNAGTKKRLNKFVNLIETLDSLKTLPLPELIMSVVEKTGYIMSLHKLGDDTAGDKIANVDELISVARERSDESEQITLSDFLDQVALVSGIDSYNDGTAQLPLMTLHLAKGLEFRAVFIVGLEEGLCPHSRSITNPDELEEERRLFYVGMTRTMEKLFLCHAQQRLTRGNYTYNIASRFLREIPEKFVERDTVLTRPSWPCKKETRPNATYDDFNQLPDEERGYRVGQRVLHEAFGEGVIRKTEGRPGQQKLVVQFKSGAVKRLSAQHAPLSTHF